MGTSRLPLARFEPPAVRTVARERVDRRLDRAWDVPLTVIVGPAGAGKTTAASHLVARSAGASLWYRAHAVDGDETSLCDHLAQAWEHATARRCRWARFADVLVDIERADRELLLVIDEFDAIIGTASEEAVAAAVMDIAATTHLVTLSRHRPSFNLSRLRLADAVCELGPDDLRFRSWEVDRLFRDLYDRPLPPDEVAELERRTGGWVAALYLFNMATSGLAPRERRAVLAQVGRRAGPDWDFLADNVLAGLRDDLELFLLETAPLPRLTAELCDELLGTSDSWQRLAELERLQLVTPSPESPGSFRTHEVLRSHLDGLLVEWEGADAARKRYRQAAESLESHGHVTEALGAFCRGEDWVSAGRLLGSRGAEVADRPGTWLSGLPQTFLDTDPWLLLAVARQQRSDGRLGDAIATYQRVERSALSSLPVTIARRERLLLASLLDRSSPPSLAWVRCLRDAAFGDLAAAAADGHTPPDRLAAGIVRLLGGEVRAAAGMLRVARDDPDASPAVSVVASLGHLVASYLAGTASVTDADSLERSATLLEMPFLTRLCRAAAGMVTGNTAGVDDVVADCARAGDDVGAAIAAAFGALAAAWAGAPVRGDARARCRATGLRNVEVWVEVADRLVEARDGTALGDAEGEPLARRRGPLALHRLAQVAAALADPHRRAQADRIMERVTDDHGIVVPWLVAPPAVSDAVTPEEPGTLEIRCLGGFSVHRGAEVVDLAALRPRARAVLRLLAVSVGEGLHRHVLCEELWPDDDEAAATRKLHVAVSSVRRVVEADGDEVVRRDGELYRLAVRCDVGEFEQAVTTARSSAARGDGTAAETSWRRALELYAGSLLPEDAASEWVDTKRRQLQTMAVDAARQLAELLLERGDQRGAIDACWSGIAVDRYADPLWRLVLDALAADEDWAGHARASAEYDAVLADLGVTRP
jgi:DNA-binding SARP family transcriptional activator